MNDPTAIQPERPPVPEPTRHTHAKEVVRDDEVTKLAAISNLAAYVNWQMPESFTDEAQAAVLSEAQEYVRQLCFLATIRQRRDGAEKALKSYVDDAASFLRNKSRNRKKILADWCKWIGFAFLGFTVQQIINVQQQKNVAHGSVLWLVMDVAVTAVLIVTGFMIDWLQKR